MALLGLTFTIGNDLALINKILNRALRALNYRTRILAFWLIIESFYDWKILIQNFPDLVENLLMCFFQLKLTDLYSVHVLQLSAEWRKNPFQNLVN